jgi:hypothetical protein
VFFNATIVANRQMEDAKAEIRKAREEAQVAVRRLEAIVSSLGA